MPRRTETLHNEVLATCAQRGHTMLCAKKIYITGLERHPRTTTLHMAYRCKKCGAYVICTNNIGLLPSLPERLGPALHIDCWDYQENTEP